MHYPEFPIIGFLAAALVLIPLPRQIRAGNIACVALIYWLFQHCLVAAVNSIIWAGNTNNVAPIWCDITNKLRDGSGIALSAATLCICKHLEFISSLRPISSCMIERRRKIFELVMCVGIPALWIFLVYCFQPVRFIINEDFGCVTGTIRNNGVTALLYGPPLLFSVITLIYGFVTLYNVIKTHRLSVRLVQHMDSRDSVLSSRQYYRLMVMGMSLGIWGVVWASLNIQVVVTQGSYPIPSWKDIHEGDSDIVELPTIILGPESIRQSYLIWWGVPGAALLFFLLFGTSYEVLYEYVKFWEWFRTTVLRQPLRELSVTMSTLQSPIDTSIIHDDLESKLSISPDDQPFRSPIPLSSEDRPSMSVSLPLSNVFTATHGPY